MTSHRMCCVQGCSSRPKDGVSFHQFPTEKETFRVTVKSASGAEKEMCRRNAWVLVLSMRKPISSHMLVCSKHFRTEDFCLYIPGRGGGDATKRKRFVLKRTAVPSLHLPKTSNHKPKRNNEREFSAFRRAIEIQERVEPKSEFLDEDAAEALLSLKRSTPRLPDFQGMISLSNLEHVPDVNAILPSMEAEVSNMVVRSTTGHKLPEVDGAKIQILSEGLCRRCSGSNRFLRQPDIVGGKMGRIPS